MFEYYTLFCNLNVSDKFYCNCGCELIGVKLSENKYKVGKDKMTITIKDSKRWLVSVVLGDS